MRSPLPENDAKEISIGSSLDEVEKEPSLDLTKKHSADTNDNFDYADRRDDKAELSKIEKKLLYFFIGFNLLCILSLGLLTAKMFADEISMQKIQQSLDENSLKWVNLKEEL